MPPACWREFHYFWGNSLQWKSLIFDPNISQSYAVVINLNRGVAPNYEWVSLHAIAIAQLSQTHFLSHPICLMTHLTTPDPIRKIG